MGLPFLAEYEARYGEGDVEPALDNLLTAWRLNLKPGLGLMAHGYSADRKAAWADPASGQSRSVWGRGQGWYVVGLIEVLDFVPQGNPRRGEALGILTGLLRRLLDFRDSRGLWQQVIDQVDREGNYPEASASAMFTYALAKAVNQGYLPPRYAKEAREAYRALLSHFIRQGDQGLVLEGTCASGGLGVRDYRDGSFASYAREATRVNDLKGIGVLLMATAQIDRLPEND